MKYLQVQAEPLLSMFGETIYCRIEVKTRLVETCRVRPTLLACREAFDTALAICPSLTEIRIPYSPRVDTVYCEPTVSPYDDRILHPNPSGKFAWSRATNFILSG
jgi:hypothetical protein